MAKFSFSPAFLLWLVCHVNCRPQNTRNRNSDSSITVVKSDIVPLDALGSASYDIELSDGTKLKQVGRTERPPQGQTGNPSIIIEGSYSYIAPDGREIKISYIADKNGFQPKGDSIPTNGLSSSPSSSSPSSTVAPEVAPAQSSPAIDVPAATENQNQVMSEVEAVAHEEKQVEPEAQHEVSNNSNANAAQPLSQQTIEAPEFEKK